MAAQPRIASEHGPAEARRLEHLGFIIAQNGVDAVDHSIRVSASALVAYLLSDTIGNRLAEFARRSLVASGEKGVLDDRVLGLREVPLIKLLSPSVERFHTAGVRAGGEERLQLRGDGCVGVDAYFCRLRLQDGHQLQEAAVAALLQEATDGLNGDGVEDVIAETGVKISALMGS